MKKILFSRAEAITWVLCFPILLLPILGDAEIVSIGPHQISVPVPLGHCVLQETDSNHNRLIQMQRDVQKGVNEVLFLSADCDQLSDWESGRKPTLDDYGLVLSPSSAVNKKFDLTNDQFVSVMRHHLVNLGAKEIDHVVDKYVDRLNDVLEESFGSIRVNETEMLGILSQDKNGLYVGMSQLLTTETGENKRQIGVASFLLIKGKPITLNLYTIYRGASTIHGTLSSTQRWAGRVQSDN
jgi:hypothetical protein